MMVGDWDWECWRWKGVEKGVLVENVAEWCINMCIVNGGCMFVSAPCLPAVTCFCSSVLRLLHR